MYIKEEIIEGLHTSATKVITWVEQQPEDRFTKGPANKWDTSQHIDHLHQAVVLINKVLRLPKFIIRWRFGKPNRKGRDYDGIVARYKEKLKNFDGKQGTTAGKKHPKEGKKSLLVNFQIQIQRLQKIITKWSEKDLDNYLVAHPLLGKITIRELMLWMIYHHYHHLNNLKQSY